MKSQQSIGFNCLHWRPRFKHDTPFPCLEKEVSIAFIGDPGSNFNLRTEEVVRLFQLPSLATPVQTLSQQKQRFWSFNCLHWRPRFKHAQDWTARLFSFQLPSLATPVQTQSNDAQSMETSFNCLHWRYRFKGTEPVDSLSTAGFNCLHWRYRFKDDWYFIEGYAVSIAFIGDTGSKLI